MLDKSSFQIDIPLLQAGCWQIAIPASKSLTNRALHLASLAQGVSFIKNPLYSIDTKIMLEVWSSLGVAITKEKYGLRVEGCGGNLARAKTQDLFIENAGTAARFITAVLSLSTDRFRVLGNSSMNKRPFDGLIETLSELGVEFEFLGEDFCTPFLIQGNSNLSTKGRTLTVSCEKSSQFLSALLMLSPLTPAGLSLSFDRSPISEPYIEMTLGMMEKFSGSYKKVSGGVMIPAGGYKPCHYEVEVDYSSASYFLALAAIHHSEITILGAREKSLQGDVIFAEILVKMGCVISWSQQGLTLMGAKSLKGLNINMKDSTDLVPALCVVAMFCDTPTVIEGIDHMRYKECDRITALCSEMSQFGLDIRYQNKALRINPRKNYKGAVCSTYDDHRMAMAFSMVGTKVKGTSILNPSCVDKTFPSFFEKLSECF